MRYMPHKIMSRAPNLLFKQTVVTQQLYQSFEFRVPFGAKTTNKRIAEKTIDG